MVVVSVTMLYGEMQNWTKKVKKKTKYNDIDEYII